MQRLAWVSSCSYDDFDARGSGEISCCGVIFVGGLRSRSMVLMSLGLLDASALKWWGDRIVVSGEVGSLLQTV